MFKEVEKRLLRKQAREKPLKTWDWYKNKIIKCSQFLLQDKRQIYRTNLKDKILERFHSDIRKSFYMGDSDALELSWQPVEFQLKEDFEI